MTHARRPALNLDIVVTSILWKAERDVKATLRRAIGAAAAATARACPSEGELAVVLTDAATIRQLNRKWRERDRPTDVLSFPAGPHQAGKGRARMLGDVVIAYEPTAREAAARGKLFKNHVSHLAVHGFLHLLGYDHETEEEAEEMEALERAILASLGITDPLPS